MIVAVLHTVSSLFQKMWYIRNKLQCVVFIILGEHIYTTVRNRILRKIVRMHHVKFPVRCHPAADAEFYMYPFDF